MMLFVILLIFIIGFLFGAWAYKPNTTIDYFLIPATTEVYRHGIEEYKVRHVSHYSAIENNFVEVHNGYGIKQFPLTYWLEERKANRIIRIRDLEVE